MDKIVGRKIIKLFAAAIAILSLAAPEPVFSAPTRHTKRTAVSYKAKSKKISTKSRVRSRSRRKYVVEEATPALRIQPLDNSGNLERVQIRMSETGPELLHLPRFHTELNGRIAAKSQSGETVYFSLDPDLQTFADALVTQARAPHVAVVAMDPRSGRVLAIADKSNTINDLALHSGFPAASLFKLITATAALEHGVQPDSEVRYRGGTYTLNEGNYSIDQVRDRRVMTVEEGLARSCNPVFGRIALNYLNAPILRYYARMFGFNSKIQFDCPLSASTAFIPSGDDFEFSRAAAGFGDVTISPIHAALMMSQIANGGLTVRPVLIDRVVSANNQVSYSAPVKGFSRVLRSETAEKLLAMMESTTTIGTSRKEFMRNNRPVMPNIRVAAKTGTLKGTNPPGLNHWFVAAAPIENPELAIAVIVVDPRGGESKASRIGRKLIEHRLNQTNA